MNPTRSFRNACRFLLTVENSTGITFEALMLDALLVHRLHFAYTVTFHYLFPQLTMGLALLIVILKTMALRTGDEHYNHAARFWAHIFGINFAMGVVTGIPMEFQFGTNWAQFSRAAGGVIGQTLAMEGVFSFFLESSFLGLFLFGEKRLGPRGHWWAAFMVFLGSWMSGYLIVATDAWMQHPVAYRLGPHGEIMLTSFWGLLLNPWALWQYAHNMSGAVITGAFVMAAVGAFYLLTKQFQAHAQDLRARRRDRGPGGLAVSDLSRGRRAGPHGCRASAGDAGRHGRLVCRRRQGAPIAIVGQPDIQNRRLDNPLQVPRMLSFLTYRRWMSEVKGLDAFPQQDWPDNIPLLYYSYHIMVGLGTIFIAIMLLAAWKLWRGTLYDSRGMLWVLMLSLPFPYIANTAGWMTAEFGRQPWLIYGLMRTQAGISPQVSSGNVWFTLIGFMGMYTVLSILFLFLVYRVIEKGPECSG